MCTKEYANFHGLDWYLNSRANWERENTPLPVLDAISQYVNNHTGVCAMWAEYVKPHNWLLHYHTGDVITGKKYAEWQAAIYIAADC